MKNVQPMGLNSTPFISYQEINVDEIDVFYDAWGFNSEFNDVIKFLEQVKIVAGKNLTKSLIDKIRRQV